MRLFILTTMKKSIFMMALVLGCTSAFAQNIAKNELKQLQSFLAQPAQKEATNAKADRKSVV